MTLSDTILLAAEAADTLENINLADAGIVALVGYGVVFAGLIALMVVVMLMGKAFTASKKKAPVEVASAPAAAPVEAAAGTAGQLKLHSVEPKTAAMLMAIVADKLGKPLNELRFTSIREVK